MVSNSQIALIIIFIVRGRDAAGQSGVDRSAFVVLAFPSPGQMNKCIQVSENLIEKTGEVI